MSFRRTSILDGLSTGMLRAQLQEMQLAYIQLTSGRKGASYSYTQGDGTKSVTYTQANVADLTQAIIGVQTQLDALEGVCQNRRAPMRPFF